MICVSIGRGRHRHVIAEHKHLVEQGAKLVELRLDYIQGEINLKRLIENRACAVVITCRRERDGGKYRGSEEARLMLLRTAIASGVEYVDLEDDIAGKVPRFGNTQRIVSVHDFRKTPDDLQEIHAGLRQHDPDIIKIATTANCPHDNVRMLELVRTSRFPTVGMCMGDMGVASRILAGRVGAPFTYATFHHERALAPGQLSFDQMTNIYNYEKIHADTVVYGVIGDPIAHSYSPVIHNAAFRKLGLNCVYVPFRVPREELDTFMDDTASLGIRGLSVTIPHKEQVLNRLTFTESTARGVGAANTVVFGEPASVEGYNTDLQAAMDSLKAVEAEHGSAVSLSGRTALILGAGGAAKAIGYGLKHRGMEVVICGRTTSRAEDLADSLQCGVVEWSERHGISADLLVNCTPVGMHPDVDETPYDKHFMKPHMIVFDTVYNPENTLLIKEARQRSCIVATGVDMFIRQAGLQFKLFTDKEPPLDVMREVFKRTIGAAR